MNHWLLRQIGLDSLFQKCKPFARGKAQESFWQSTQKGRIREPVCEKGCFFFFSEVGVFFLGKQGVLFLFSWIHKNPPRFVNFTTDKHSAFAKTTQKNTPNRQKTNQFVNRPSFGWFWAGLLFNFKKLTRLARVPRLVSAWTLENKQKVSRRGPFLFLRESQVARNYGDTPCWLVCRNGLLKEFGQHQASAFVPGAREIGPFLQRF